MLCSHHVSESQVVSRNEKTHFWHPETFIKRNDTNTAAFLKISNCNEHVFFNAIPSHMGKGLLTPRQFQCEYRGTQRQFSENICSEYDLRSRIFETIVVKFRACLPVLGFSNI